MSVVSIANANGGPHGNYSATTDACAGCHRAHSAGAGNLLLTDVPALCLTCHGSSATGANTNVDDGVYTSTGSDLLAGGFLNFQGAPSTSAHSTDGSWQNAWGSGTTWSSTYDCSGCHNPDSGLVWPGAPLWGISPNAWPTYPGRGQNVTMPLTCTSCHEPHGGRNYRVLQQRMHPPSAQQEDPPGYVLVTSNETGGQNPDQAGYVPDYTTPNYRLGLGDWCTGCHFTYQQDVSVQPFNAEDGKGLVTRYRHKQNVTIGALTTTLPLEDPSGDGASADDQLFCITCHYAHGTNVAMSGEAASVAPTNDSALLRHENRTVCEDCHKK
ncbi:MAG: cytochrome c3 family protein [Chloroflexi bacterium]|nr:cytochrome c3 family protein [Chloroflexota bacterium]